MVLPNINPRRSPRNNAFLNQYATQQRTQQPVQKSGLLASLFRGSPIQQSRQPLRTLQQPQGRQDLRQFGPIQNTSALRSSLFEGDPSRIYRAFTNMAADQPQTPTDSAYTGTTAGDPTKAQGVEGALAYKDMMTRASQQSGVPWEVLAAIMGIETGGQNLAPNGAGAVGVMQIVPKYWQDLANKYGGNLSDPWTNIRTAADILKQNYDKWGSWDQAAAAYFGAIDSSGNITGATDSFGTSGYSYVDAFHNNLASLNYGSPTTSEYTAGGQAASAWAQSALSKAMTAQGTPYVFGGESYEEGGFDCSGLVTWAYGSTGKYFGRTAQEQYNNTSRITSSQLQPGDLVFFSGTTGAPGITHVGIYIGNGQMLEAPTEGDVVKIVSLNSDFWNAHLAGYGRVN